MNWRMPPKPDSATGRTALDAGAHCGRTDCSVFHLCRSFRRAAGLTLHSYREQVRLHLALERLDASAICQLASISATRAGHFTAFQSFAVPTRLPRASF
jgi:methylphosphotriester-DNA--protein-cysteine methyltransferase